MIIGGKITDLSPAVKGNLTGSHKSLLRSGYRPMSRDLPSILDRIEKRLVELGTSADAISNQANKPDAIRNLRRKVKERKQGSFNLTTGRALARALGVTPEWLLEGIDPPPKEPVIGLLDLLGQVEAGGWREVVHDPKPTKKIVAARDARFPEARQYLLEVRGDSMNAATPQPMPHGSLIRCVEWWDTGYKPATGQIVVVRRFRGEFCETTVKRVYLLDGRVELRPESTDPSIETLVVGENEADPVEIAALVTAVIFEF